MIAALAWQAALPRVDGPPDDGVAWAELVARHDRRVVLSLVARGVRLDRARELAQDTWARLIEQHRAGKLERLDLPGVALTQAAFLARDDARRSRRARRDDDARLASIADFAPDVESTVAARERLERARVELARCSPTARRVFTAVYEDPDAPHADAAEKLGMSVQRVRQTLCEVRSRLRRAVDGVADASVEEGSDD